MNKSTTNPDLFRRLSEPHESRETLETDLAEFYEAVSKLRAEHGLLNVYILVETPVMLGDEEQTVCHSIHFGDSTAALPMVARAYGAERERHEQLIASYLKSGRSSARRES